MELVSKKKKNEFMINSELDLVYILLLPDNVLVVPKIEKKINIEPACRRSVCVCEEASYVKTLVVYN